MENRESFRHAKRPVLGYEADLMNDRLWAGAAVRTCQAEMPGNSGLWLVHFDIQDDGKPTIKRYPAAKAAKPQTNIIAQ
jgi:hypothetical protein